MSACDETPILDRLDRLEEKLDRKLPDERPLYSVATLAVKLGVSERMVRQMLGDEVIPSYLVGGARRVDPGAVDEYLARQRRDGRDDD